MQILTERFCSLSTSPSWQAWLYHHNVDIYRKFINSLNGSRGCGENRELMKEVLSTIDDNGGGPDLSEFLLKHYPDMVEGGVTSTTIDDNYEIFPNYNPDILTYPRRIIFTGPKRELMQRVRSFLLDKIQSDFIISDGRVYVEYLKAEDAEIMRQIPQSNWQISQYRQR